MKTQLSNIYIRCFTVVLIILYSTIGIKASDKTRPDKMLLNRIFKYENSGDEVKNLGNATFRVISVGKCKIPENDKDGEGCRERYYVMPDKAVRLKHTDITHSQSHIGIWHKGNYISVK